MRSFGPCALSQRHLHALATKAGEISGLEAGLQHGPNKFTLRFSGADIEDLDPATGQVFEQRSHPFPLVTIGELRVTEGVPYYPSPPPPAFSFNPDVRSMFDR